MVHNQSGQPASERQRSPRLSPELNEFLHMLDALEGQFAEHRVAAANKS